MTTLILTLKARNQIGETLKAKGIANDCDFDADGLQVTHVPTGSCFRFSYDIHAYTIVWQITDGPETEWPEPTCKNWEDVLEQLGYWADEVHYVATTPDFWQELERSRAAITAVEAADIDNSPFLPSELDAIVNSFEVGKLVVSERYALPNEQQAAIGRKLDELVEASRTMGRKDWLTLVGSTGFTLIVGSLIPANVVQHVLGLALGGIARLFGVDLPPLALA